jgi:hypothetical protein
VRFFGFKIYKPTISVSTPCTDCVHYTEEKVSALSQSGKKLCGLRKNGYGDFLFVYKARPIDGECDDFKTIIEWTKEKE